MNATRLTDLLLEKAYSYSCLMIDAPTEIGDRVVEWGELNIPDDVLFVGDNGDMGRELEAHVTVKFGMTEPIPTASVYNIAHTTQPFPITVGKVSLFRNEKFDVVKCDVESDWLRHLNSQISREVPNEDRHPEYHPHLTVAYVKKGTCDQLEGMDIFEDGAEWMAYGMVWKGAGDDDQAPRHQEVLLFSKVKQHGLMHEAAVGPSQADMEEINQIIQQAQDSCNDDPRVFVTLANDELSKFGVKFEQHPDMALCPGTPGMATDTGVYLRVPDRYMLRQQKLTRVYAPVIYHELVHGHQLTNMSDPAKVTADATAWVTPRGHLDQDRYLQQKQEVMAWAASMVDSWRRQGLNSEQMLARLRNGHWGMAEKYWYNRQRYPKTFQRFVRDATDYIQQHGRAAAQESADSVDPQRYVNELPASAWTYKEVPGTTGRNALIKYYGTTVTQLSGPDSRSAGTWVNLFNALERYAPYHAHPQLGVGTWYQRFSRMAEALAENGPENVKFDHAAKSDPYADLPFPASSDDLSRFMRHRKKKRASRPVL